jgi:hypothetical protein
MIWSLISQIHDNFTGYRTFGYEIYTRVRKLRAPPPYWVQGCECCQSVGQQICMLVYLASLINPIHLVKKNTILEVYLFLLKRVQACWESLSGKLQLHVPHSVSL